MVLQDIFDHLMAGEFSQMNIFGSGQGVIDDSNTDKVLSHINLALSDLYTRFELKTGVLNLVLQPGQTSYLLTSKHAVNGRGAVAPFYILDDVANPYKDDLLQILRVLTDTGFELPLNRIDTKFSLMASAMNRLEVPIEIVSQDLCLPKQFLTTNLVIPYRANHPIINPNVGAFDPTRLTIELPYTHLTAMLYFIASRANNPVGMGQEFNAGNTYAAKYEAECARLKNDGLELQQRGGEDKFSSRGFV